MTNEERNNGEKTGDGEVTMAKMEAEQLKMMGGKDGRNRAYMSIMYCVGGGHDNGEGGPNSGRED